MCQLHLKPNFTKHLVKQLVNNVMPLSDLTQAFCFCILCNLYNITSVELSQHHGRYTFVSPFQSKRETFKIFLVGGRLMMLS